METLRGFTYLGESVGGGCETLMSILVMWLECWFLDTEVDDTNPDISMLCP